MRAVGRLAAALLLALSASGLGAVAVYAADPVTFEKPTADSAFGRTIEFEQRVVLEDVPSRVEILLRTPGVTGPSVTEIETRVGRGEQTLTFELDLAEGHFVPNTTFVAQWRVTDADGRAWLGPEVTHTYLDDRLDWKTLSGDVVRVHWHEGGNDFGRRALAIGEEAVEETAAILGVTETEPIDFYIYGDQDEFYDALGPGTRENVGGQAHSDIRTMFALITPNEIDDSWVEIVVPHELVHLVFATATDNPYHEPPHWLNEGLAVYLSEGYKASDRAEVDRVARNGTIIPLEGLAGAFPTTFERFVLGYAESVAAVDHIVEKYGRDALVKLIRSYATGVSDDEAFTAALGVDLGAFEAEWLESLGAQAPVRHGPQPAPAGPVPEGWSGAAPIASVEPGPGSTPGAPGASQTPNRPPSSTDGDGSIGWLVLFALAGGLVLAFVLYARRRAARPGP